MKHAAEVRQYLERADPFKDWRDKKSLALTRDILMRQQYGRSAALRPREDKVLAGQKWALGARLKRIKPTLASIKFLSGSDA